MEKYILLNAIVAEIKRRISEVSQLEKASYEVGLFDAYKNILSFLNTLEVKEIPETTHTECKKIKKLCEIQRYDENGEAYSVMLPDTRLFMSKINDIIDVIDNINSRLLMVEQRKGE